MLPATFLAQDNFYTAALNSGVCCSAIELCSRCRYPRQDHINLKTRGSNIAPLRAPRRRKHALVRNLVVRSRALAALNPSID